MGNGILYIAASLDGYIAGKDGGVGWLDRYHDSDEGYGYGALVARLISQFANRHLIEEYI
jgi:hypothetical protein